MAEPHTIVTASLDPDTVAEVAALAAAAEVSDGVRALSEGFRLALGPSRPGVTHLLRYAAAGTLVGYAQVAERSAELVVAPDARRRGHGRALLGAARVAGAVGIWSHGDLPPARALARTSGLVPVRTLLKMARALGPQDQAGIPLPAGWSATTFVSRPDLAALTRVNAAAFAHHREQGLLTQADLAERMAQPWFDPQGLYWLVDLDAPTSADPAGFHWTKIEPGSRTGEVYVVGLHPDYQGRGLAGPLTHLGLHHLASSGCTQVELYVDGDNAAALATYRRAGFSVVQTHVVHGIPDAGRVGPVT